MVAEARRNDASPPRYTCPRCTTDGPFRLTDGYYHDQMRQLNQRSEMVINFMIVPDLARASNSKKKAPAKVRLRNPHNPFDRDVPRTSSGFVMPSDSLDCR